MFLIYKYIVDICMEVKYFGFGQTVLMWHWLSANTVFLHNVCYGLLNRNWNCSFCETESTVHYTWNSVAFLFFTMTRACWTLNRWCCGTVVITRSSGNAEEPREHTCQLKSCKMLYKCSTNCIWKGLQPVNDLQGHSRSLPLLPLSCTIFEILRLICQKIKTSRDVDDTHLGDSLPPQD